MADWKAVVRENLKDLDLGSEQEQEILAELSGHLEDHYEELRESGHGEAEAVQLVTKEPVHWKELERLIRRAKQEERAMNKRTKTLWLPGLATLALAAILLVVLEQFSVFRPELWWKDCGLLVIHISWWIVLPFCGAYGAHRSRRSGGQALACITAGLFPAIVMLCVFGFVLPVSVFVDRNPFVMQHRLYFLLAIVDWAIIPGFALFLGASPWLRPTTDSQT